MSDEDVDLLSAIFRFTLHTTYLTNRLCNYTQMHRVPYSGSRWKFEIITPATIPCLLWSHIRVKEHNLRSLRMCERGQD